MDNNDNLISIFIGYDSRERAATNVLIDSIYQNSTVPVSITPLVKAQLESQNLFYRKRDKNHNILNAVADGQVDHRVDSLRYAIATLYKGSKNRY